MPSLPINQKLIGFTCVIILWKYKIIIFFVIKCNSIKKYLKCGVFFLAFFNRFLEDSD